MSISRDLLTAIKNRLNITWDDEATDNKIAGITEDGIYYLNDKLGEAGDYDRPGYPRMLLMEYVRYGRDEALDVFENNYLPQITAMQNKRRVEAYVEKTKPPEL